ncbi:MAG: ABC transporter ATP-binding protein [Thermoleophilaceae bacterium]|nr:ABC transporter ATP-binding protein [Thermoleophilaceae bacterium]
MPVVLEAKEVGVQIGATTIVEHANLELAAGQLIAIVGPNGAGKSTFVRALSGIQNATGTIAWNGRQLAEVRGRELALMRAFVPQRALVPPGLTVRDAVTIGRSVHVRPWQRAGDEDRAAVEAAIERVGVAEFADRQLTTLSGGELQRVQVAVALAQDAPVLVADEPTSALDLGATVAIARLLRGLADDGLAVLLVVHDLTLAAAIADRVVVMSDGTTVASGTPREVLTRERISAVWGVEASLEVSEDERTALHVSWLD